MSTDGEQVPESPMGYTAMRHNLDADSPSIKAEIKFEHQLSKFTVFWRRAPYLEEMLELEAVIQNVSKCVEEMRLRPFHRQLELLAKLDDALASEAGVPQKVLSMLTAEIKTCMSLPNLDTLKGYADDMLDLGDLEYEGKRVKDWGYACLYPSLHQSARQEQPTGLLNFILKEQTKLRRTWCDDPNTKNSGPILRWFHDTLQCAIGKGRIGFFSQEGEDGYFQFLIKKASSKNTCSRQDGMPWSALGIIMGFMVASNAIDASDDAANHPGCMATTQRLEPLMDIVIPRFLYDLVEWKAAKEANLKGLRDFKATIYGIGFLMMWTCAQIVINLATNRLDPVLAWIINAWHGKH